MNLLKIVLLVVLSVFLYQNCGSDPQAQTVSTDPIVSAASLGKIKTSSPLAIKVQQQSMQLDLVSFEVVAADAAEWVGSCLVDSKAQRLQELLNDASICETDHAVPEDALCAMIYVEPYMRIAIEGESDLVAVGEQNSSCPKYTTHLCENDEETRELIQSIDPNKDLVSCN